MKKKKKKDLFLILRWAQRPLLDVRGAAGQDPPLERAKGRAGDALRGRAGGPHAQRPAPPSPSLTRGEAEGRLAPGSASCDGAGRRGG